MTDINPETCKALSDWATITLPFVTIGVLWVLFQILDMFWCLGRWAYRKIRYR